MADGYARASGKPGVCVLITGPGMTNAGDRRSARPIRIPVPMLVLSSVNATRRPRQGSRPACMRSPRNRRPWRRSRAFSRTVRQAQNSAGAYADAYRIFEAGRPRPVHIELPLDLLAAPGPRLGERAAIATPPAPAPISSRRRRRLIAGARRPVILAGGGMVDHGAVVKALAEKIGAAVIPTVAAKGAVPDSHPLCARLDPVPAADLRNCCAAPTWCIAVGTELAETDVWIDRLPITGKLIRIDIDPATLTRDYPPEVAILADGGHRPRPPCSRRSADGSRSQIDRAELARIRDEHPALVAAAPAQACQACSTPCAQALPG